MVDSDQNCEDRALDALMAAAFRISGSDEAPTEKQAEELASNPPLLSPEDEAAISSMGPDFVDRVLEGADAIPSGTQDGEFAVDPDVEEAYAAMNRGGEESGLSDETLREIARKRRELLGQEDQEEDKPDGPR